MNPHPIPTDATDRRILVETLRRDIAHLGKQRGEVDDEIERLRKRGNFLRQEQERLNTEYQSLLAHREG